MSKIQPIEGIGTHWFLEVFEDGPIDEIRSTVELYIKTFEKVYSRFIEGSFLSKLNQMRRVENPPDEFLEMMFLSRQIEEVSGGYFSVFFGKELNRRGYDSEYSFKEKEPIIEFPKTTFTYQNDVFEIVGPGDIDLGGLGKGFLLDKLNEILRSELGLKYFLINGGGDLYVSSNKEESVEIVLENPKNPRIAMKKILLRDKSICASSPYKRNWKGKSGQTLSHLMSIEGIDFHPKSTFVVSKYAVLADAYATALSVGMDPNNLLDEPVDFFFADDAS